MVDPIFNLDLHKTPSERIQRERRVFYSLWRRSDDDTTVWLKRVHNCIHRCEYPSIIMEFLLFDRFMCGLNDNELESLQNVNNSWTLEQLLEYFSDENIGTEHIENSLMVDENVNHNENVSLDWVKFETNAEEWSQIDTLIKSANEDDEIVKIEPNIIEEEFPFDINTGICDTENTSSHLAMDEEEIDNEVLSDAMQFECEEYKFDVEDAVIASDEENGKSHMKDQDSLSNYKTAIHGCEHCGKRFGTSQKLKYHVNTHTGDRPFACDQCKKTFFSPYNLIHHKKSVHQRIRPHACQQCSKRFSFPSDLKKHSITHSGKTFSEKKSLSYHKSVVHRGIRSNQCDQCEKCFYTAKELKQHMVTHSTERPFECDQCDKAFKRRNFLNLHKRSVHQQIRLHECHQCHKRFTTTYILKRHSITHTGERPYACDECNKSFVYSSDLTRHKKLAH